MSNKELISRFSKLTGPYHERLFRIALTLCRNRDQAADLTQESLVRAFMAFDTFRKDAPVLPWLAKILKNLYLDMKKSGRLKYEISGAQGNETGEDPFKVAPAPIPNPHESYEREELRTQLRTALEQLDEAHQLIILLCDIEGMSYAEAAEIANVPLGTVRSRLSRARETLRQKLRETMTFKEKHIVTNKK